MTQDLSIFYRVSQISQALFWGFDWAWNPTHTTSALKAIEGFMNQKTRFPKLEKALAEAKNHFMDNPEFHKDMETKWHTADFLQYPVGSLGHEYALFMQNLGFEPLGFNLASHIPQNIQNYIQLGVKNHDFVHLLLGIYDNNNGKYNITDYHEWIFLSWTLAKVDPSEAHIVKVLLSPTKFKAFLTGQTDKYNQAMQIGQKMAVSADLNILWLHDHLDKPIAQVRQELRIKTMQEI